MKYTNINSGNKKQKVLVIDGISQSVVWYTHMRSDIEMITFEFKSKFFEIVENLKDYNEEVIITKNGSFVATLVPYKDEDKSAVSLFGYVKNSVKINGDIVSPIEEKWEAEV